MKPSFPNKDHHVRVCKICHSHFVDPTDKKLLCHQCHWWHPVMTFLAMTYNLHP